MTSGIVNGTLFLVVVDGDAIAGSVNCKLITSQEVRNTTVKSSAGWDNVKEGKRKWQITADGLVILDQTLSFDSLYTLLITNRSSVTVRFTTSVSGDSRWYGSAYCTSLEMDAPTEGSTTYSVAFEGTGVLTQDII